MFLWSPENPLPFSHKLSLCAIISRWSRWTSALPLFSSAFPPQKLHKLWGQTLKKTQADTRTRLWSAGQLLELHLLPVSREIVQVKTQMWPKITNVSHSDQPTHGKNGNQSRCGSLEMHQHWIRHMDVTWVKTQEVEEITSHIHPVDRNIRFTDKDMSLSLL